MIILKVLIPPPIICFFVVIFSESLSDCVTTAQVAAIKCQQSKKQTTSGKPGLFLPWTQAKNQLYSCTYR